MTISCLWATGCCYRCCFCGLLRLLFRWGIYTQQNKWNQLFCIPDIDHHRYLIHHFIMNDGRIRQISLDFVCHSDSQLWELKFMMSGYMAPSPLQRWQEKRQNSSQESFRRILINENVYSYSFYHAIQINDFFFSISVYHWLTLVMEKSIQMRKNQNRILFQSFAGHDYPVACGAELGIKSLAPNNPSRFIFWGCA